MSFLKKHKTKIIIAAAAAAALVFAFLFGGASPERNNEPLQSERATEAQTVEAAEKTAEPTAEPAPSDAPTDGEVSAGEPEGQTAAENKSEGNDNKPLTADEKKELAAQMAEEMPVYAEAGDIEYSVTNGMEIDESTGMDKYLTEPVPENRPLPVDAEDEVIDGKELTCTLSVRCDTIFDNIERLDPEKAELLPADGVIFAEREVVFYEGESVFNLLLREMKKNKIHMEYENTPIYNSAYIEGIGNLYEYDCGELSGWMYKVNGWFPNYGCSRYELKAGDKVEFEYTCNLGADIGGRNEE